MFYDFIVLSQYDVNVKKWSIVGRFLIIIRENNLIFVYQHIFFCCNPKCVAFLLRFRQAPIMDYMDFLNAPLRALHKEKEARTHCDLLLL